MKKPHTERIRVKFSLLHLPEHRNCVAVAGAKPPMSPSNYVLVVDLPSNSVKMRSTCIMNTSCVITFYQVVSVQHN